MKKFRSLVDDVIEGALCALEWLAPFGGIVAGIATFVGYVVSVLVIPMAIVWGICFVINVHSAEKFTERTGIETFCTMTLHCYAQDDGKVIPYDTWVLRGNSTKIDINHLTGDTNGDKRTEGQENR